MPASARSIARAVMAEMNGVAPGADALVARAAEGSGHALPDGLRARFESSLGVDLGGVRVHTDGAAAEAAEALSARAYATGQDVFMGAGEYRPDTAEGAHLLAHEVAHTVQQRDGAHAPQCKLEVSAPGDAAELEADAAATAMLSGLPTTLGGHAPAIHRWLDERRAAWARDFIESAPPEDMAAVIQQIRAARAQAPSASAMPVRLTLGPAGTIPAQSGTILFEDLDDLLDAATTHARAGQRGPVETRDSTETFPNTPGPQPPRDPSAPLPATVREHDRHTQASRPTGVEGTPVQTALDRVADRVQAALGAWSSWRGAMQGTPPGRDLFAWFYRHDAYPEDPDYFSSEARTYLRHRLGAASSGMLEEMISFSNHPGSLRLADLLGVTVAGGNPAGHHYHISVRSASLRREGPLVGGVQVRDMTITYTNRFGMHYEHQLTGLSLTVGAGPSVGSENGPATGELDLTPSEGDSGSSEFWPADRFHTQFLIGQAQLGGGGGAAGVQRNRSWAIANITFRPRGGGHALSFDLSGQNDSASATPHGTGPRVQAGAGIEAGVGHAIGGRYTSGAEPPRTGDGGAAERSDELQTIYTTELFFATGSAELPPGNDDAIERVVARVDDFATHHPDARLEVDITAYASPRWRGARDDADADQHNLDLSAQRSHAVAEQLRNAIHARANGGACDFRTSTCRAEGDTVVEELPPQQARGSADARGHGATRQDDPPAWRRVVIAVRGSVYRRAQVETQPQPPAR